MIRTLYEILDVPTDASPEKLKKQRNALAKKWHPDNNPGDPLATLRATEINTAYEVLNDQDQRASYDRGEHPDYRDHKPLATKTRGDGLINQFVDVPESSAGANDLRRFRMVAGSLSKPGGTPQERADKSNFIRQMLAAYPHFADSATDEVLHTVSIFGHEPAIQKLLDLWLDLLPKTFNKTRMSDILVPLSFTPDDPEVWATKCRNVVKILGRLPIVAQRNANELRRVIFEAAHHQEAANLTRLFCNLVPDAYNEKTVLILANDIAFAPPEPENRSVHDRTHYSSANKAVQLECLKIILELRPDLSDIITPVIASGIRNYVGETFLPSNSNAPSHLPKKPLKPQAQEAKP